MDVLPPRRKRRLLAAVAVTFSVVLLSAGLGSHEANLGPPPSAAGTTTLKLSTSSSRGEILPSADLGRELVHAANGPSPTGPLPDAVLATTGLMNHTFQPGYHPELSGASPSAIAVDNSSGDVFVAQSGSNTVSVLNPELLTIKRIGVGSDPDAIVFDPAGNEVFVANFGSNNITVIGASNLTVVADIPVGAQSGWFASSPTDVVYDSDSGNVFVTQPGAYVLPCCSYNVTEISGRNNSILRVLPTVAVPASAAFDPALDILAVMSGLVYSVELFNATSGRSLGTFSFANPTADISIDSVDGILAVVTVLSSGSEELTLANLTESGLTGFENYTLPVPYPGLGGMTYDSDAGMFLLSSANIRLLGIYPLNGSSIAVGSYAPCLSSIFVDWSGSVLIGSACADEILSLNRTNFAVEATAVTGFSAGALLENTGTHQLLVADSAGDTVATIDSSDFSYVRSDTVGVSPESAAYDPSTNTTFVLSDENYQGYDSFPNAILTPILVNGTPGTPLVISATPLSVIESVVYDQYDDLLYAPGVTSPGGDEFTEESLAMINPVTDSLEGLLNVSSFSSLNGGYFDQASAVPISAGLLIVSNPWQGAVMEVNSTTGSVVWSTQVGGAPTELVVVTGLGLIFAENAASNSIDVLNLTGVRENSVGVEGLATGITYDPLNGRLYVATDYNRGGQVESFNASSQTGDPDLFITSDLGGITYLQDTGMVAVAGATTGSVYYLGGELATRSLTQTPPDAEQGSTLELTTNVSGGYPPYTYNWSGLPPPCSSASGPTLTCVPGYAGNFTVKLNVTDLAGEYSEQKLAVNVDPYPLNVSIIAKPSGVQPTVGSTIECFAVLSSTEQHLVGTNLSYNWSIAPAGVALIQNSTLPQISVTFGEPGTETVKLSLTWNGTPARATLQLNVTGPPASGGGAPPAASWTVFYFAGTALAVAVIAIGLLTWWRLRRPRTKTADSRI